MKIFYFILLVSLIFVSWAAAAFPSGYYPDGDHPRLWLTTAHVSMLQTARAQNTAEWRLCSQSQPCSKPRAHVP